MRKDGFGNILMYILMVFLFVGLGTMVYLNVQANKTQSLRIEQEQALAAATPIPTPTSTPSPTPAPVRNTEATLLAFCGDLVAQEGLVSDARVETSTTGEDGEETVEVSYDFAPLLENLPEALAVADYAACTLDGVIQASEEQTAYRAPVELASALRGAGFSLVNTATDNALLFGLDGLGSTLTALDEAGVAHTGTYASQEAWEENSGVYYAEVNGLKLAFLGYTYGTNDVSAADNSWCINILTTDYMTDQTTVDYERLGSDLAAARAGGADLVICYVYWWDNTQYYTAATPEQQAVVDYLCSNGADVILGGGVKTPQPIEVRQVERDGVAVNCLVANSIGNLASCLNDIYTNLSAVLYVEVSRDIDRQDVWISGVWYKPLFMLSTGNYTDQQEPSFRYRVLDLRQAMSDFENGQTETDCLTEEVYDAMTEGLDQLRGILGPEYDEQEGGVLLEAPAVS